MTEKINENAKSIISNLEEESVSVYFFLYQEFLKGDVTLNPIFQFVYRSFYRLDNAGLTPEFKTTYFELMQQYRNEPSIDPVEIVNKLYSYKRRKGDHSIQFSFTTKLINTIDPKYPIYDSEVARVFQFSTYHLKDIDKKIARYLQQQDIIIHTYSRIIKEKLLEKPIAQFDTRFNNYELPLTKKLDFIFWSYGKLLRLKS
ncbi:hypothetical protein H5P36_20135 [Bacillus sp. APMAM]|nr:hypothetical protein [Bacillus sp. APMAM]RTZ54099.1 hypothetical protein EKO25_19910 [Bacillus sp. SAJ1]